MSNTNEKMNEAQGERALVRLLLVDDEALIRQGLKILISMDSRIEVVAEAANGLEAIAAVEVHQPDIVLMDIRMPQMDGREATRQICERWPHIKVLILTTFSDMEHISQAMHYGAAGYLLKDSSPELIIESLFAVAKGSFVAHPSVADKILQQAAQAPQAEPAFDPAAYELSEGQIDIIRLVASGHSNREIADKLFLSEGTVKNKLSAILQTLGLRDRTQVAVFAWEKGLMKDNKEKK